MTVRKKYKKNSWGDFQLKSILTSGKKSFDVTFLLLIIVALAFGLIVLLSASAPVSRVENDNSYYLFQHQLYFALGGFIMMWLISFLDYHFYQRIAWLAMIVGEVLLLFVLIWGVEHNGATRWLYTGFEWQPSELVKPAIAIFFATLIDKRKTNFSKLRPVKKYIKEALIYLFWIGLTAILLLKQPHLSCTIVIVGIAGIMILVAGLPLWLVGGAIGVVGPIAYFFLKRDPVRWARVINFQDPFMDVQGVGYQVVQSLYAIGNGGLFGMGLGQGVQKHSYLPEPHNDFIFSVICEELGLLGAILVITLFAGIIIRGMKIAVEAPDRFGTLVAVGLTGHVAIQAILNIAVACSAVPNTGISLPFFSYGGTAIVVQLCEMGILLNISRYRKKR